VYSNDKIQHIQTSTEQFYQPLLEVCQDQKVIPQRWLLGKKIKNCCMVLSSFYKPNAAKPKVLK